MGRGEEVSARDRSRVLRRRRQAAQGSFEIDVEINSVQENVSIRWNLIGKRSQKCLIC